MGLDKILVSGAPTEFVNLASQAKGSDFNAQSNRLLELVGNDSSKILGIIRYLDVEDGSSAAAAAASEVDSSIDIKDRLKLAAKLLYRINPQDLIDPNLCSAVKKVETAVRNQGFLNHEESPDLTFKAPSDELEGFEFIGEKPESRRVADLHAHKGILALESDYFKTIDVNWKIHNNELSPESDLVKQVLDYVYMPDDKRKEFIQTIDKVHLPEVFELANRWLLTDLINDCDLQICNNLNLYDINRSNIDDWIAATESAKNLNILLKFVKRIAQADTLMSKLYSYVISTEDRIPVILENMNEPIIIEELLKKCRPDEFEVLKNLSHELSLHSRAIEQATKDWQEFFGLQIKDVPPIPKHIIQALNTSDSWEDGKLLKQTFTLFLVPKELKNLDNLAKILSERNIGKITKLTSNPEFRRDIEASEWILIRNQVIGPFIRDLSNASRYSKFNLPTVNESIAYSFMELAKNGKFPYERAYDESGTICHGDLTTKTPDYLHIQPDLKNKTILIMRVYNHYSIYRATCVLRKIT